MSLITTVEGKLEYATAIIEGRYVKVFFDIEDYTYSEKTYVLPHTLVVCKKIEAPATLKIS